MKKAKIFFLFLIINPFVSYGTNIGFLANPGNAFSLPDIFRNSDAFRNFTPLPSATLQRLLYYRSQLYQYNLDNNRLTQPRTLNGQSLSQVALNIISDSNWLTNNPSFAIYIAQNPTEHPGNVLHMLIAVIGTDAGVRSVLNYAPELLDAFYALADEIIYRLGIAESKKQLTQDIQEKETEKKKIESELWKEIFKIRDQILAHNPSNSRGLFTHSGISDTKNMIDEILHKYQKFYPSINLIQYFQQLLEPESDDQHLLLTSHSLADLLTIYNIAIDILDILQQGQANVRLSAWNSEREIILTTSENDISNRLTILKGKLSTLEKALTESIDYREKLGLVSVDCLPELSNVTLKQLVMFVDYIYGLKCSMFSLGRIQKITRELKTICENENLSEEIKKQLEDFISEIKKLLSLPIIQDYKKGSKHYDFMQSVERYCKHQAQQLQDITNALNLAIIIRHLDYKVQAEYIEEGEQLFNHSTSIFHSTNPISREDIAKLKKHVHNIKSRLSQEYNTIEKIINRFLGNAKISSDLSIDTFSREALIAMWSEFDTRCKSYFQMLSSKLMTINQHVQSIQSQCTTNSASSQTETNNNIQSTGTNNVSVPQETPEERAKRRQQARKEKKKQKQKQKRRGISNTPANIIEKERKQKEEALRKQQEEEKKLQENINELIKIIEKTGGDISRIRQKLEEFFRIILTEGHIGVPASYNVHPLHNYFSENYSTNLPYTAMSASFGDNLRLVYYINDGKIYILKWGTHKDVY